MVQPDPAIAEALLHRLREMQRAQEPVPNALLGDVAERLHRSPATIRRWLALGVPAPRGRRGFQLTDEIKAAVFDAGGRSDLAWKRLASEGLSLPSIRTFQRAVRFQMTARERAYAKEGVAAARMQSLFLERQERGRGICMEADHKLIDAIVVAPRSNPKPVWIAAFIDTFSRLIAGIAISVDRSQADVLAGLGDSIQRREELGPAHGAPSMLRIDRGMEWTANSVTAAASMFGTQVVHTPPRTPHKKGKIERFFKTLIDEFLVDQPYYNRTPRKLDGSLRIPAGVEPLSLAVFIDALLEWVRYYNYERPHESLAGRTPAMAWDSDSTPIQGPVAAELRRYLLKDLKPRKVAKRGIHVFNRWYIAAQLEPLIGRFVEVRGIPNDERSVEIYSDGAWLATAYPHSELSEQQREDILAARRERARQAGQLAARATRRARRRFAPTTTSGEPTDITPVFEWESDRCPDPDQQQILRDFGIDDEMGTRA